MGERIVGFSIDHPKVVTLIMVAVTMILGAMIPFMKVDTDPENMLSKHEAVRVFHNAMKRAFSLHDMVVMGIVNEEHPDGVFNPDSLRKIYELTEFAKTLRWQDPDNPEKEVGVIEVDLIAPSTVDNIEQGGLGVVKFEWLMSKPPKTIEEAREIRRKAQRIPFLNGTLVSEDGKAICIYLPLTAKNLSYRVYSALKKKIAELGGPEKYFITGLPVAEDTFGVEMFKQMAISAPLAMVIIFLLMLFFFKKLILIISPMIVALVSVICTMGLLIGTGNTVHIMSSMIPIFVMPIAVLDSIHILSEFFDRYQEHKDRRETILFVMDELFVPMLYTSLTSMAGFVSLALTPIPPVQVFGIFVGFGIMLAWVLTVTFIPAYVMFIREKTLENFGSRTQLEEEEKGAMSRFLAFIGGSTYRYARLIIVGTVVLAVIAAYGIRLIRINDNPTRWFSKSHPIRVADRVLNRHFGGTYMAYLLLEAPEKRQTVADYLRELRKRAQEKAKELQPDLPEAQKVFDKVVSIAEECAASAGSSEELLKTVTERASKAAEKATGDESFAWDEALLFLDTERQRGQIFKEPEVLRYMSKVQEVLASTGIVGKSNSLSDIVKTVHRELLLGKDEEFRIPESRNAVAQCLITFQNSHRPQDLWHFVTSDYTKSSIWVQLKSGDNKDMEAVARAVDKFIRENPPPLGLKHAWFGLTYINVIWQNKMVSGMLQAFLGSFLVVFLMMTVLFGSSVWGFLCMVPLTVTIAFIYGMVGILGKDYDMPVAVLSSLTLGLAVDFAIHFLVRSREMYRAHGKWETTAPDVFGEPARAITRNIIVIATGFLPLLLAPLVPYKTVGTFIATILAVSGIGTLLILPSLVRIFEGALFPATSAVSFACNCTTCLISAVALVALIAVNVHQFMNIGWNRLAWFSLVSVLVLAAICRILCKRSRCLVEQKETQR